MSPEQLLSLLRLPSATLRQWRVAKDDFAAQLASPADRRCVKDRVESRVWHAALNTDRTGLTAGAIPTSAMPGVAVLVLTTKIPVPPPRLVLIVHRAVPEPLMLVTVHDNLATTLSVKPGLGEVLSCPVPNEMPAPAATLLALDRASSLADLHARWCQAILGLSLARSTGTFPPPLPAGHDAEAWQRRRAALDRIVALDREIERLTQAARREKQLARRAELNQTLQSARRERQAVAETV